MENKVSEKRMTFAGIVLLAALFTETAALWNEYAWYEKIAPYGTLITLVFLTVIFFLTVPVPEAVRDPYFWIMAFAMAVSGINLIVVGSGKGAFLTSTDVLLVIFLADRIKLPQPFVWTVCAYTGFYFFYWTFDVKGYFKGYNTNYGGLVLITGFVFAMTGLIAYRERLKKYEKGGAAFLLGFMLFMVAWGYNIIAWYRARVALLAFAVFVLLLIVPGRVFANRVFYTLLTLAMTAGSIVVSLVYVWLGRYLDSFGIRIFYKDIISGRDAIWADLWNAFMKKPMTGIGSSYTINVDWMGGMFEVHNGLLDILIVHGVFVFAVTVFMLVKRLLQLREKAGNSVVAKSAVAAVFAMLAGSFMENFFIVPPFLLCMLALIAIAGSV